MNRSGVASSAPPLLEEYQKYVSAMAAAGGGGGFIWGQHPQKVDSGGRGGTTTGGDLSDNNHLDAGRAGISSTTGPPLNMNIRDANELMKRLEEKIMDRMKIQMDTLYQKIEDKMML